MGLEAIFRAEHPLIGMVHLPALPGEYRAEATFESAIQGALHDAEALKAGGADGLLVENFGGVFGKRGDAHVIAILSLVAREVRVKTGLPVGVNVLRNDPIGSIGAAEAAGGAFVRVNVLSGVYATDQGLVEGEADKVSAYRARLGAHSQVWADVFVKHAVPFPGTDLARMARETYDRGGADALIVTGEATGNAPPVERLRTVRENVPEAPLIVGSGLTEENAAALLHYADAAIVGTAFKRGGDVFSPVDSARVRRIAKAVQG